MFISSTLLQTTCRSFGEAGVMLAKSSSSSRSHWPVSHVSSRSSRTIPSRRRQKPRYMADNKHNVAASASSNVTPADLLDSLTAEARFAKQLQDPGFKFVVDSHLLLHDIVSKAIPLARAPTKVSDAQGVFLRQGASKSTDPTEGPLLRVQTLQPTPSDAQQGTAVTEQMVTQVDWAHHTFALSPFYCYSKSSVFTADGSLVPHLELEMGVTPGQSQVLLYVNMDPKMSPTLHPAYLDHFYLTPPPSSSSSSSGGGSSSSGGGSGSSGSSWADVESRAAGCPGFIRFTSPDLHVRAFSSTAILFKVNKEGWSAAKEILSEAVAIWVAWATLEHAFVDTPPAAAGSQAGQAHTLPEDIAARSWAWRRFPRRERAAGMMKGVFGEQTMEDYWDSMAGDVRIRL